MSERSATARACANIALVKYWGKRDSALNLPAAGSLSLTLAALVTETTVTWDSALGEDTLELDGAEAKGSEVTRTREFIQLVRELAGVSASARVVSTNHFPTASGLASSASGYAALALAATAAAGLQLDLRALSVLARRGSGSAARSVFGGFARMHAGERADGTDAYAEPVASPLEDRVRMVIAVVGGGGVKPFGSRDAMEHCAETSPLYRAWVELVPNDLAAARAALIDGDLGTLGEVAEANALAMHAAAIASRPAIMYWQPGTLAVLGAVRALRGTGVPAWSTMDAGPHVKVLTTVDDAPAVVDALRDVQGVTAVMVSAAGAGVQLVPSFVIASAPGKLILCGEYAVLDGAPALVIAVTRRAVARVHDGPRGSSPFLAAVADEVAAHGGDAARALAIAVDSRAFYEGAQKLGLGSSAAVTVAATALALGEPLDRARVLAIAMAAHARAQGARGARGSGADIAAAVYGGAIEFRMGADTGTPSVRPGHWPTETALLPFFTGASADTATLVTGVVAARAARPADVDAALAAITSASRPACIATRMADRTLAASTLVGALRLAAHAMQQLAAATALPLVPDCVTRVHAALVPLGGLAKTTGAGGGDVAVAVIPNTLEHATAATRYIIESGGHPLDLAVDHTGVDLTAPAQ